LCLAIPNVGLPFVQWVGEEDFEFIMPSGVDALPNRPNKTFNINETPQPINPTPNQPHAVRPHNQTTTDLEELLKRSKVECHSAFGNALEAALSLAERYDQVECGQVLSTALSDFKSDRRKSASLLAAAETAKYATRVVNVDVEEVQRAKAVSTHESKVQEVISAALNTPQNVEQLERALDLGNQIMRK
jgi:hypothetical protein